jgi:hypothetical protein
MKFEIVNNGSTNNAIWTVTSLIDYEFIYLDEDRTYLVVNMKPMGGE